MINAQEFFTHSLHDSDDVADLLAHDGGEPNIFEYPCEEELGDNPGKPYIVVQNTGTTQVEATKDDPFDPMSDNTKVEVTCVADSKEAIKQLAHSARKAIAYAMDNQAGAEYEHFGFWIEGSSYSDHGVQFDVESGNYFVTLSYQIETQQ